MKKLLAGVLSTGILLTGNLVHAEGINGTNGNSYAYGQEDAYGQLKKLIVNPWNYYSMREDLTEYLNKNGINAKPLSGGTNQDGYWENDVYHRFENRIFSFGIYSEVELTTEQRNQIKRYIGNKYNGVIKWEEHSSAIESSTGKLFYYFRIGFDLNNDIYTPTEQQMLDSVKAYMVINYITGNPTIEKSDNTYIIRITNTNIFDEGKLNTTSFYGIFNHIRNNFYAKVIGADAGYPVKGEAAYYFTLDQ